MVSAGRAQRNALEMSVPETQVAELLVHLNTARIYRQAGQPCEKERTGMNRLDSVREQADFPRSSHPLGRVPSGRSGELNHSWLRRFHDGCMAHGDAWEDCGGRGLA